jgi:hypothetical protein
MGRVINVNNPGKVRKHHMRTIAEILRHITQKSEVDEEAKDMAAFIVYALREIDDGVEDTIKAWEKRGYWMKAERFLREWRWTTESAANIEDVLRHEAWDLLPRVMADLFPRISDIQIKRFLRKPSLWRGTYQRLMAEEPRPLPY